MTFAVGSLDTLVDGHLLAVDAGSDDIASFAVRDDGSLTLVDRVASGGDQPSSARKLRNAAGTNPRSR